MTENIKFNAHWYESTYPHILFERDKFGIQSSRDHYDRIGKKAGWYSSPFMMSRSPGEGQKIKDNFKPLFPWRVFNFLWNTEKYLYRCHSRDVSALITEAWHKRSDKTASYFEVAAEKTEGEPHFVLHAALEYCLNRQFVRANNFLSHLNEDDIHSEYHHLLLCFIFKILGRKDDLLRVASSYVSKYRSRMLFHADTVPGLRFCRSRRTAVLGFQFLLFALFNQESRSTILIDGQEVTPAFGEPRASVYNLIEHFGPASASCDVCFSALLDIRAPLEDVSHLTIEILNETTRFNGQVDTFSIKTDVPVIDDLFSRKRDVPVPSGHLIRP